MSAIPPSPEWSVLGWEHHSLFQEAVLKLSELDAGDSGPVPGVYVVAKFASGRPPAVADDFHLDPRVLYIGKSMNLAQRLTKNHKALTRCLKAFNPDEIFIGAYVAHNFFHIKTRTSANRLLHAHETGQLKQLERQFKMRPEFDLR